MKGEKKGAKCFSGGTRRVGGVGSNRGGTGKPEGGLLVGERKVSFERTTWGKKKP